MAELASATPDLLISNRAYDPAAGWAYNGSRPGTNLMVEQVQIGLHDLNGILQLIPVSVKSQNGQIDSILSVQTLPRWYIHDSID